MASKHVYLCTIIVSLFSVTCSGLAAELETAQLHVDASWKIARKIPETLFGIFFEEINHAGAGGLWAELVNNRGFEAGGRHTPSNIDPWRTIGNDSSIAVMTEQVSCFARNIVALRIEVLCERCPDGGVGIYNPGFWGMNIEEGKVYNLVMYVRSQESVELTTSLTCPTPSGALDELASTSVQEIVMSNWTKVYLQLLAHKTCRNSRLELKASKRGVTWFDQVSLMPADTYKGHGFRKELMYMLLDLKPRFLRFPGGCFVEGNWLRNAFRWKETVGPWEERPGHYGDVWNYWTDDGLGYFEFLQKILVLIQSGSSMLDAIDSLEFAMGSPKSTWGSVRAAMGHPDPFLVNYIAIGNEDCVFKIYPEYYILFYKALREAYPEIKIISNCDGSVGHLDHPADLYDVHIYRNATVLLKEKIFDTAPRTGPKAFVSEYAVVNEKDYGNATLFASLVEAAFLTTLEKNRLYLFPESYPMQAKRCRPF